MSKTTINKEERPKPCCICLDEKKKRDECLLFNDVSKDNGMLKCKEYIDKYKSCMKSFGYDI
ncbi:Cytochrome c oxidase copper chaperone [Monosporozyma unispora]|nr:Cytochrome c oxidase copper chaperone [Kazachstania unispora]